MEAIVHQKLRLEKSMKKAEKSSFLQKIDFRFHHLQLYLWDWTLFDNYIYFFLLLTNTSCLFRCIESVHIVPYLNLVVWIFNWCHFCDILIKFANFWGPMEATFSSWILSSKLSGTYNRRASNMGHEDSRIHHIGSFCDILTADPPLS